MSFKAKPILEDRFWIIEKEGVKIGTLSKEDDGFVINQQGNIDFCKSKNQLRDKFGCEFLTANIKNNNNMYVHGYPTRCKPYNSMYDINRKLPLFTKSEKSKSIYCAGYYLIKFNVNYLKSFCPKLITIERNEYFGPFKTELEMKAKLSHVNKSN